MLTTPVLFIVFNRPETTRSVFEAIRLARPRQLFVAADGPRKDRQGEEESCKEVREIATNVDWDCEVKTLFRDENRGCGLGAAEAITWFFEHVDKGIILEDDCLPEFTFFPYCEKMLNKFSDDENIMMIAGTNYFFNKIHSSYEYYHSNLVFIWGWATWKRAWKKFDIKPKEINIGSLYSRFGYEQYANLIFNGINRIKSSYRDVWDIQWLTTIVLNNGTSILPIKNQIRNIGYLGTHTSKYNTKFFNMPAKAISLEGLSNTPGQVVNTEFDLTQMKTICWFEADNYSFLSTLKRKLKKFIKYNG